jgi:cytochrome P450
MNLSCCRSFLHDPAVYPEPESFKPERFLRTNPDGSLSIDPDVPDPRNALFGYGRRVCPGKYWPLAQATDHVLK